MDNVLIVVEDLEAAKAFFAELGMELEGGRTRIEEAVADGDVCGVGEERSRELLLAGHARRAARDDWFRAPPALCAGREHR